MCDNYVGFCMQGMNQETIFDNFNCHISPSNKYKYKY